eukprot:gene10040-7015_t
MPNTVGNPDHLRALATDCSTLLDLLPPRVEGEPSYIDCSGPIDPESTLIRYDVPYAVHDPKKSLKLRRSLGLPDVEERSTDPNVRVIIDRFITPRRWTDQHGTLWVQHASPFITSRTDTLETHKKLKQRLGQYYAKETGTCPIRTILIAECYLEVIRMVTAECWERGLLLLYIHAERVAAQASHREIFESRVGHAFRLTLKGEKDTTNVEHEIAQLKKKIEELVQEEKNLRKLCDEFSAYAEEQTLIENKEHNDAVAALKKEGLLKRNQLEKMAAVPTG